MVFLKVKMNTFLFFDPRISIENKNLILSSEESRHVTKVLRFRRGDKLLLTNGLGTIFTTEIIDDSKKEVEVSILNYETYKPAKPIIRLATSPVKNRETMEWLVEKATEIGVTSLHFFTSEHSERTVLNIDRLEKIVISAIKQSLNPFKPEVNPLLSFDLLLKKFNNDPIQKLMAHCDQPSDHHISNKYNRGNDVLLMIGPEGGFSEKEVETGRCMNFDIISLGNNRLRTETASIYALTAIQTLNNLK
jgi:16S rRNA (uracil1498-N3)-methyltransferase